MTHTRLSSAYVLLNAETDGERELIIELKKMPNIEETYLIHGAFNILVKVKGESFKKLRETVLTRIRSLKKVRSTLTMIINQ